MSCFSPARFFSENFLNKEFQKVQGSIPGATLSLLYMNDLPDDVICNIATYAGDTTLYSKWSFIWFAAATEVGFWTWIWSTKHCHLELEVTCSFPCCKNSACLVWPVKQHWCYLYVKMDGSVVFEEKLSLEVTWVVFLF